jgi:hypothetical protein
VLSAQFKAGKTTLRDCVVRSLVDGDPFLGRDDVVPVAGTVAIVDTEMPPGKLDAWLRDQGVRHDDRVVLIPIRGAAVAFDLMNPSIRTEWAVRFREFQVQYLILDCLRPVLDAIGLDEQREAGRFLVAFDALLAEAGIPESLIVHHMGHLNERARGDSRLRDWPDVEWRLVRQGDDPASARFLSAYGRDVEQPEQRLAFDPITRRLTLAGGSRRDARVETALAAVREVLVEASEARSGRAIKQALLESELPRDLIDQALVHGVRIGALDAKPGPRRSRLYSVSASVRSEPAARTEGGVSDRPTASKEADTPATHPAPHLVLDGLPYEQGSRTPFKFNPRAAFLDEDR